MPRRSAEEAAEIAVQNLIAKRDKHQAIVDACDAVLKRIGVQQQVEMNVPMTIPAGAFEEHQKAPKTEEELLEEQRRILQSEDVELSPADNMGPGRFV